MKPSSPLELYRVLLAAFGRQGWWPTTPAGKLRPEYRAGKGFPRSERERFEIAVGALLTQNTAWSNVERALANLHREGLRDPRATASASPARLRRLLRPSGYFAQKAEKLKRFSLWLRARGGRLAPLLRGPLAEVRARLLDLHGFGPETADSVLLYAGGRPVFVVDAYTLRIGARVGWEGMEGYEGARAFLERALPRSPRLFAEFHALLVELAKRFCRPEPLCAGCPARPGCRRGGR